MNFRQFSKSGMQLLAGAFMCVSSAVSVQAQSLNNNGPSEILIPGIWIDPDGCEHWVMDDGWEGFMSPVVLPNGLPVCGRDPVKPSTCGVLKSDHFFATDSAVISPMGVEEVKAFFKENRRRVFAIEGHTDSRASDAYNLDLSNRRAAAVASVGQAMGADIRAISGWGERQPRASNSTRPGRALNRRVEIICLK